MIKGGKSYRDEDLNLYEVDFAPIYPVGGGGLLILANNIDEAKEIALEILELNGISGFKSIERVKGEGPRVVFFDSGEY